MEKRLTIKVDETFHMEIKKRAVEKRITITRYVKRALLEYIRREKLYENGE